MAGLDRVDVAPLDVLDRRGYEAFATVFGTEPIRVGGVARYAVDPESARRLWELGEQLPEG